MGEEHFNNAERIGYQGSFSFLLLSRLSDGLDGGTGSEVHLIYRITAWDAVKLIRPI
jgi:hypothetical protein